MLRAGDQVDARIAGNSASFVPLGSVCTSEAPFCQYSVASRYSSQ